MRTAIHPGTSQPPQQSPASPAPPVNSPSAGHPGLIATTGTVVQHPVAPSGPLGLPPPLPPPGDGGWKAEWLHVGEVMKDGERQGVARCPYCYFVQLQTGGYLQQGRKNHLSRTHAKKGIGLSRLINKGVHTYSDDFRFVGWGPKYVMYLQCKWCAVLVVQQDMRPHSSSCSARQGGRS